MWTGCGERRIAVGGGSLKDGRQRNDRASAEYGQKTDLPHVEVCREHVVVHPIALARLQPAEVLQIGEIHRPEVPAKSKVSHHDAPAGLRSSSGCER